MPARKPTKRKAVKRKAVKRPPRIFVKKGKLYIKIGSKKYLIKDQNDYSKRDLMDIILKELVVRRKKRKRGKITKKEKKHDRDDLRVFNEFEKLNRNQSKVLKLPPMTGTKSGSVQRVFNALATAILTLPNDVNVDNRLQIKQDSDKIKKANTEQKTIQFNKPQRRRPAIRPRPTKIISFDQQRGQISLLANSNKRESIRKLKQLYKDINITLPGKRNPGTNDLLNGVFNYYGDSKMSEMIDALEKYGFNLNTVKLSGVTIDSKDNSGSTDIDGDLISSEDSDFSIYSGDDTISDTDIRDINDYSEVDLNEQSNQRRAAQEALLNQLAGGNYYTGTGISTGEIDKMMKPFKSYIGTFPADFITIIPKKLPGKFGFVMNLDKRNKPGSHWVAVFIDTVDDMSIEYYDSFAQPPTKQFMRQIKQLVDRLNINVYLKFKVNGIIDQNVNTSNCGFFAMDFLSKRFNDVPFREVTKFDNSVKGERGIQAIKENFGYI